MTPTSEDTPGHIDESVDTRPSQPFAPTPTVGHMTTLKLNNGVEMPAIGLGVFQTPPEETRAAVEAALATGYRQPTTPPGHERDPATPGRAAVTARITKENRT